MIGAFKENVETFRTRFADSPLGKQLKGAEFNNADIRGGSSSEVYANDVSEHALKKTSEKCRLVGDYEKSSVEKEKLDETRELTDAEKQELRDSLGWGDRQISKCTIDENGVIHYRTDRSDLEGKQAENGVPYERKQIEINGFKIEGVFPKFDSIYTTELSAENQKSNAYAKECNAKLKEAIPNDPELKSKFTAGQLNDIENNRTPTGYVWHHNETPGKMELVKRSDHDRVVGGAAHTGGSVLWGPDSVNKVKMGENF